MEFKKPLQKQKRLYRFTCLDVQQYGSDYGYCQEHNLYVIEDNAQAIGANCKFSDGTKRKQELLVT
jgi:hypothetical protein